MIGALRALMVAAMIGLAVTAAMHGLALLRVSSPLSSPVVTLAIVGVLFVIWLPIVLVSREIGQGVERSERWKAILRGCPGWVLPGMYALMAYTLLNFVVGRPAGTEAWLDQQRFLSGSFLIFYYAAVAVLYSATRPGMLRPRLCPYGHEVRTPDDHCPRCGAALPPPSY